MKTMMEIRQVQNASASVRLSKMPASIPARKYEDKADKEFHGCIVMLAVTNHGKFI